MPGMESMRPSLVTGDAQLRRRPAASIPARDAARGVSALMFLVMLIAMLGFCGMALDLGRLYNRKVELQQVANAAAIAAARELNGTSAGVAAALSKASIAASRFKYQYNLLSVSWSDAAISFGTSSDHAGTWLSAGAASGAPVGLQFVKVDTKELEPEYGTFSAVFMGLLSSANSTITTSGLAIAGRSSINVLPLAVCALSNNPATARANPGPPANVELLEFGFRRGVSYDLMQLNPGGAAPANYVIDPVSPPGVTGSSSNMTTSILGPFVCAGSMAMPSVTGGAITVSAPFPLASLFQQLNSRFDQFSGELCNPNSAPSDANVKAYTFSAIPWMSTVPAAQSAAPVLFDGGLVTIADPSPAPASNTASMYGPLWSYARAVPYSSYSAGLPEPASGYSTFSPATWTTLYRPGQPLANSGYPGVGTPYNANIGANFLAPSVAHRPGMRQRRVLKVPLLACPVGAGATTPANVIGIGKFFMTVPATATSLNVEFAGTVPPQSAGGQLELYP